ncbi:MAG TPA: nucleotidyltransferase domain-containing protein [Saprospiraceae bacterium]|nr:nucleotidyltransferase domain-containing protein [Saprospiraceae bacterium]HMP25572.1 nucleotidyltransferase domain-containing protein [Saprospiraceae bacterium]
MQDRIVIFLKAQMPDLKGVYCFGSRATGQARPDSDWDIAFLRDARPMPPIERWDLQERLAAELSADVDLIDLQEASTVLRFQIISTGARIFCADTFFCGNFEIMCYSAYQYLQKERREIIEDIIKRGSVYG